MAGAGGACAHCDVVGRVGACRTFLFPSRLMPLGPTFLACRFWDWIHFREAHGARVLNRACAAVQVRREA